MKPVTMQAIRERFPRPGGRYCVGGALLLYAGECEPNLACFPSTQDLAAVLRDANPKLTGSWSNGYAVAIIEENDHGHYDEAWRILDNALTHE